MVGVPGVIDDAYAAAYTAGFTAGYRMGRRERVTLEEVAEGLGGGLVHVPVSPVDRERLSGGDISGEGWSEAISLGLGKAMNEPPDPLELPWGEMDQDCQRILEWSRLCETKPRPDVSMYRENPHWLHDPEHSDYIVRSPRDPDVHGGG